MAEFAVPEKSEPQKFKTTFRAFVYLFAVFATVCLFVVMIFPIASLPQKEYHQIHPYYHPKEALIGDWGDHCCNVSFAIFLDGREKALIGSEIMWSLASPVRLHLQSPYYVKNPDGNVCRIVYARTSLFDPFEQSCMSIKPADRIQKAFADGHAKFMAYGQQAKTTYERYRSFKLVE